MQRFHLQNRYSSIAHQSQPSGRTLYHHKNDEQPLFLFAHLGSLLWKYLNKVVLDCAWETVACCLDTKQGRLRYEPFIVFTSAPMGAHLGARAAP